MYHNVVSRTNQGIRSYNVLGRKKTNATFIVYTDPIRDILSVFTREAECK